MKKLLLLSLLIIANASFSFDRTAVLNAIIESDYTSFMTNYDSQKISSEDVQNFIDMNEKVITLRQKWMVAHSFHPQICKDLCISFFCFTAAMFGFITMEASAETPARFMLGLGTASAGTYFAIKKYTDAFLKPRILFANAIKIKDVLLNNN